MVEEGPGGQLHHRGHDDLSVEVDGQGAKQTEIQIVSRKWRLSATRDGRLRLEIKNFFKLSSKKFRGEGTLD